MKKAAALIPTPVATGDIYALVDSLTAAEKTAIRKIWGKSGAKKLPLHIFFFEEIANGRVADDAGAQAALGLSGGPQFSNLKQHLATEVLDALVHALRGDSPSGQLHFGIMQVQALVERGHAALARRLCKKLWTIADNAGLYGFALDLLYYKGKLIDQRSFRQYSVEADEIAALFDSYTSYQHTAQKIQRHTERLALMRAADQLRVSDEHHEMLQDILSQLSIMNAEASATPHLRLRYLAAVVVAGYMLQQTDSCTAWSEEGIHLIENKPALAATDPESFINVANLSFYNEFAKGDISRVSEWLSRYNHLASGAHHSSYYQKRWAIIRFNTTLKIAHKTGDYEAVAQIVDKESNTIIAHATEVMPAAEALSVITSILISFFVLERFHEAEELMIEIKERNRSLDRQDVFYFTLVFHLVILYELKDWYRLDSATEAAYHVLYNRKKLRPFEKELMRFLKALPMKRGRGGTTEFIRAFVERLDVYRADPVQRLYFLYFNYYDWLQSKLAGVSYREYKKRLLESAAFQPAK